MAQSGSETETGFPMDSCSVSERHVKIGVHDVHLKEWTAFSLKGRFFLIRVKTQFSQELSSEEYQVLQTLPHKGACTVTDEQLRVLEHCKLIDTRPKTEEEETEHERRLAETAIAAIKPFSSVELLVVQACNMQCRYCYGEEGSYGNAGKMTWDIAVLALDRMIQTAQARAEKDGKPPHASILFFGGEPLMNLPLIEQCVAYCNDHLGEGNTTFSLTTNGILLTPETMDWLDDHKVRYSLSFDGPYQNENRPIRSGQDSHSMIVGRIQQVIDKHGLCSTIGTFFPHQKGEAIIDEIHALFGDKVSYQVNPVSNSAVQGAELQRFERESNPCAQKVEFAEKYPVWTDQLIDAINKQDGNITQTLLRDNYFKKFFLGALDSPGTPLQTVFCGCGRAMCSVDIKGDCYPCQGFVGNKHYCQGNVSGEYHRGIFAKHITQENSKCRHCSVRYACPGDCMINAFSLAQSSCVSDPVFYASDEFCRFQHVKQQLGALIYWSIDAESKAWFHRNFDSKKES